jgi:Eco57I restriction-modification methylase
MQTEYGMDAKGFVSAKQTLRERLKALEEELNRFLAKDYGVKLTDKTAYAKWVKSHQPFHWFVEFYGIVSNGGFDVIIGNPPYVEYSRSGVEYRIPSFVTAECDNLWAFVVERALTLMNTRGRMSLITPLSLVSTERFAPVYQLLSSTAGCATFLTLSGDAHPSVLFAGVKMSFTIFTCVKADQRSSVHQHYTTKLYRWLTAERPNLFSVIEYCPALPLSRAGIPFKIGSSTAANVITKINAHGLTIGQLERKNGIPLLYHRIVRHFVKALFTAPYFWNERDGEKKSEDYKLVSFEAEQTAKLIRSYLLSSTYYLFFLCLSDAYHCGRELVLVFPTGSDKLSKEAKNQLVAIGARYERDLYKHSVRRRIRYQATGWIEYDEFYPRESKPVADEIDRVLAAHYGFTDEELDFIPSAKLRTGINYDIKYHSQRLIDGTRHRK